MHINSLTQRTSRGDRWKRALTSKQQSIISFIKALISIARIISTRQVPMRAKGGNRCGRLGGNWTGGFYENGKVTVYVYI